MTKHTPVLIREVIKTLAPQKNDNFIDGTLGFGGHAKLILEKIGPHGKLLGIDQDIEALEAAKKNLETFGERFSFYHGNFLDLGLIRRKWNSTYQLSTPKRGFSFNLKSLLDMRMDPTRQKITAADIVNNYSEKDLSKILFELGEERFAKKITAKIVLSRKREPIKTTDKLVEIIKQAMPPEYRYSREHHFATSTFRALRMAVNNELENLKRVLPQAVQILSPGGRIAVISFHSLEDRIVKNFFHDSLDLEILTKKPIVASQKEIAINPKARSAKLRVAKKL